MRVNFRFGPKNFIWLLRVAVVLKVETVSCEFKLLFLAWHYESLCLTSCDIGTGYLHFAGYTRKN